MYEKKYIQQANPFKRETNDQDNIRNVYWGEVVSIEDLTEGGRIKVRIDNLDNQLSNENLAYCYPLIPKFFHIFPKTGEVVRIILEDTRYPQRSRLWIGSIFSQLQKLDFESKFTALSTTNHAMTAPEKSISNYPDAVGIYPDIEDIAILGRNNSDIILRERDIELRAGQHEFGNNLKLNTLNPASIKLSFDEETGKTTSSNVVMADRIALISHDGIPKFKSNQLDASDRDRIFSEAHPLGRGDVIVDALEILRKAIIEHIHPYAVMPVDKSGVILDLEKIDFTQLLQKNIVIN